MQIKLISSITAMLKLGGRIKVFFKNHKPDSVFKFYLTFVKKEKTQMQPFI